MRRGIAVLVLVSVSISASGCETLNKLTWRTVAATGIGCAAGLGIGAVIDEYKRHEDTRQRRADIFGIFRSQKQRNDGKIVGLATGCLAGLGVGLYLDLMHEDMQNQFGQRGITLEKVAGPNGETQMLKVKMDGDINFATGQAALTGVAQSNVGTLREALAAYPETKIRVIGHTDGTGTRSINERLSRDRAQSVSGNLGLESDRIAAVQGVANDQPLPGTSRSGNVPRNRRVEVYILAEN
ncbi:MAG: OmpA family protein [Leptospirales bacterium]|nr:OmpA family protein [Leptospirales bacterium]